MVGIMFSDYATSPGFPWHVSATNTGPIPLFQNTGLQAGQTLGCDIVGYEWDKVFNNGSTPPGLVVLATSQAIPTDNGTEGSISQQNKTDTANTAYYIAPSGAMVFASGSIYWAFALDALRLIPSTNCKGQSLANGQIQKLMANVMDAIAVRHQS
jgi:hypothetical protein